LHPLHLDRGQRGLRHTPAAHPPLTNRTVVCACEAKGRDDLSHLHNLPVNGDPAIG
jgi:hypothetical protein